MIITVSGTAGSGKSSVAKAIAERLGYLHYSMGDLQREFAEEKGFSISEWGRQLEKHPEYDRLIDLKQEKLGREADNFVLDSWISASFIPHAIKIFLDAGIEVRVKRRLGQRRRTESFLTPDEARKDMLDRQEQNRKRFRRLYNFDYLDMNNYDIVIDTSSLNLSQAIGKAMEGIRRMAAKQR